LKHFKYNNIVVKVGTNVLTTPEGLLARESMANLVRQIATLNKNGLNLVLVSSGAVGAGRSLIKLSEKTHPVETRQVLSSIGQISLIHSYSQLFETYGQLCAQLLVTKSDFRDRQHYLNMQTCIKALQKQKVLPIVNENDAVSVSELMFTDNDELAGLIASMIHADALIILTNVDGIYDNRQSDPEKKLIREIDTKKTDFTKFISPQTSNFGRGGMITKCNIAQKLAQQGIAVHIANGRYENAIIDILSGNQIGTQFLPQKRTSSVKRWVAHSEDHAKGIVYINEGAENALYNHDIAASLLPVGIVDIEGEFKKGDIIKICSKEKKAIGYGMAKYNSKKARELVGQKGQTPLIHYDYLYLKP